MLRTVKFELSDLHKYRDDRNRDRDKTTINVNGKICEIFWGITKGLINKKTIEIYINEVEEHYQDSTQRKHIQFVKAFLEDRSTILQYEGKTEEASTINFIVTHFLKLHNESARKPRKINTRILEDQDIRNLIRAINESDNLDQEIKPIYTAFSLFNCYTGMRQKTTTRLTVKEIKEALSKNKPIIFVPAEKDKNNTEHRVPIHPLIVSLLKPLIDGKIDEECLFTSQNEKNLRYWLKTNPIKHVNNPALKIEIRDLRKYFIQKSMNDLQMDGDLRCFIEGHQLNAVVYQHYAGMKPEKVYDRYMESWGNVYLIPIKQIDDENQASRNIPDYNEFKQLSNEEKVSLLKRLKYRDVARLPPEEQYWIERELEILDWQERDDHYEQQEKNHEQMINDEIEKQVQFNKKYQT